MCCPKGYMFGFRGALVSSRHSGQKLGVVFTGNCKSTQSIRNTSLRVIKCELWSEISECQVSKRELENMDLGPEKGLGFGKPGVHP